jgi:heat shock protein HtpX
VDRERLAQHRLDNRLQSLLLLATLAALLGLLAWVVAGSTGVTAAFVAVIAVYIFNPIASPQWVALLYRGRLLRPIDAPSHYALLRELAARAGLPRVPRLFYIPSRVMNAFATGTGGDSLIAVSDGLLRRLDMRELAGVLAHEISHVANEDLRVMAFADLVSRLAALLGLVGQLLLLASLPLLLLGAADLPWLAIIVLLLAPTLSALVQLALSRNREYEADLGAAELTGDPVGLASALDKLERYQGRYWEQILLPGRRVPDPSLLRSHPETSRRIDRLLSLERRSYAPPGDVDSFAQSEALIHALGHRRPSTPRRHLPGHWY